MLYLWLFHWGQVLTEEEVKSEMQKNGKLNWFNTWLRCVNLWSFFTNWDFVMLTPLRTNGAGNN